ncbi:MAG: LPS export ABC transporter periplasmic protein LptC [Chitinophagaceae bacterium]|nr:LPS export ABC transporter periplasmic protein LptC [Chitinophagaceae bacterium]
MKAGSRYLKILAALITSCFFVLSCENDIREVNEFMKKQTAIEEGNDVTSFMSQDGKIKARLRAPYMLRYQADSPYVEFPRTVHVDFYDDSTRIESTVDALYARYREYEDKVLLRDSVVVINIFKGDTLRTSELWWDKKTEEFTTDKPVRIYQKDKTIYGRGLKAAQDFNSYDIFNITGTVLTSGKQLDSL